MVGEATGGRVGRATTGLELIVGPLGSPDATRGARVGAGVTGGAEEAGGVLGSAVGSVDGWAVGSAVRSADGWAVGSADDWALGSADGRALGFVD